MKLYLDDVRTPIDVDWDIARNYEDFVKYIEDVGLDNISLISFDHDLGDTAMQEYYSNVVNNYELNYDNITEKTGYDCVKWLINHYLDNDFKTFPKIQVHSANPIGAANIIGYVNNFFKNLNIKDIAIQNKVPFKIDKK